MNERLLLVLFLELLLMIAPVPCATLAQVPAPPLTQNASVRRELRARGGERKTISSVGRD